MQTKGSPIHHCSEEGGANYTTAKIMTYCCFVCPLRDYNAEDGGVEGKKIALQLLFEGAHEGVDTHTKQTHKHTYTHKHTNTACVPAVCTSSLLAGMINPVQSGKILTLNRKVLLRLREALIYLGTTPSTLIILVQVQAQIPLPPAVALCCDTHTHAHTQIKKERKHMQPAPIALRGCTYSVWVAQRTPDVTAVKDCVPRFSTNANNKPIANTNTCTQTEFVLKRPLMQHMFSCFWLFFLFLVPHQRILCLSSHTTMEEYSITNERVAFKYLIK